jgi:serine protease Do
VLGLYLRPLTPALKQQLGLPAKTEGLLIAGVEYDGEAAAKGLAQGDIITEANQQKVGSLETLASAIKAAKAAGKAHLLLKLQRGEDVLFMTLPLK